MRKFRISVVAVLAVLLAQVVLPPGGARAAVDLYTTPGYHTVNGRDWHTECVPYSQTQRCRTDIRATTVTYVDGRFTQKFDWVFNNLTYVASPRSLWVDNPLASYGEYGKSVSWTADDGRKWRTDCDTSVTGRNGCRSYIEASVIEANRTASGTTYQWVTKWIFNNMVRFTVPPPGPQPIDLFSVLDPQLRNCIRDAADLGPTARYLSPEDAAGVTNLFCMSLGIETLDGFPTLPHLGRLRLDDNELRNLDGMPMLPELQLLRLDQNPLTSIAALPNFPELGSLNLIGTSVNTMAELPELPSLTALDLANSLLADLAGVSGRTNLEKLGIMGTQVTSLTELNSLPSLTELDIRSTRIFSLAGIDDLTSLESIAAARTYLVNLAGMGHLPELNYFDARYSRLESVAGLEIQLGLREVYLEGNLAITDLTVLQPLVDVGCVIDIWPPGS